MVAGCLFPLIAVGLVWGCSSDDSTGSSSTTPEACGTTTIPTYASLDFSTCTTCHSSALTGAARQDAPVGIDFDTYDAAKANAAEALSELEEGAMPPAGSPAPSVEVMAAIAAWSTCGTPQ